MAGIIWEHTFDALQGFYNAGCGTNEIVSGGYNDGHCLHTKLRVSDGCAHGMVTLDTDDEANYTNRNTLKLGIGEEYWIGFRVYMGADWAPETSIDGGSCGNEVIWQCQAYPDSGEPYRSPVLAIYIDGYERESDPRYNVCVRYDETDPRTTNNFTGTTNHFFGNVNDDVGHWVDWIFQVKWQWSNSSDGFVKVWKKQAGAGSFSQVVDYSGGTCSKDDEGPYPSFGVYFWEWPSNPGDLSERWYYWDDMKIGSVSQGATQSDVEPAYPPSPDPPSEESAASCFAVASAALSTDTGTQNITTTELGGATPDAALLIVSSATAADTTTAHAQMNVGATDGTNVWCTSWCSEDAQDRTDLYATTQNDHLLVLQAAADGATDAEIDFSAFIANGITIDITNAPAGAYIVKCFFWAGIEDAEAGVLTTDATQDQATTVTTTFQPQAVYLSTLFAANESQAAAADVGMALAVNDGSASQACISFWASDNQDTSYLRGGVWEDKVLKYRTGSWGGELGFSSSGFTVTTVDDNGSAVLVGYLAIRYGDNASVALKVRTSATSTGTQATSGVGFQPHHAVGIFTFSDAKNTYAYGDHGMASFGLGAGTTHAEGSITVLHQHNVNTSVAKSVSDTKYQNIRDVDGTDGIEATIDSLDSDGYTLNHTVTDGTARYNVELLGFLSAPESTAGSGSGSESAESQPAAIVYPAGTECQLWLRQADGTLAAILPLQGDGGILALNYRKQVNAPGLCVFELNADGDAAGMLEHRGIVEVWRRNASAGLDWYRDFTGLILRRHYHYSDRNIVTVYAPGVNWLLGTRHILWHAGTADRTAFTGDAAETIANTLVSYNACSDATTTNGRVCSGVISVLSAETASTAGNTLDWYCSWDNLLESLQDLADVGGGDWDVVQTGDAAFEWRWYDGQLGTDRSSTVVFALEYGNMAEPAYDYDRRDEAEVCIALGQGEGSDRITATRTSGDSDVEIVVDARDVTTGTGLEARGDVKLAEHSSKQSFTFRTVPTPARIYGQHYGLGDIVTARYGSVVEVTRKITAVTVSWEADGREVVTPEFGS